LRKAKKVAGADCQNTREMLDLYLDNELLVETSHSVLHHLSSCPDCAAEAERRIELRGLLKAAFTQDEKDERAGENVLRRRIETALDKEQQRGITSKIAWAALAASLILTIGLVYSRITGNRTPVNSPPVNIATSSSPPPQVLVAAVDRDAVANHQACALTYPSNWTYDEQRVARELTPRFAPLVHTIGRKHASYELIEGHNCSYERRQYVHLIFRGNGHTVSVFIEPDEPGDGAKPSRPREIDQTSYTAYQVASVDTGLHHIFVVSDLPTVENLALANQLVPATLGFVRKLELGAG
jgi:anti-sigma factor RsiW